MGRFALVALVIASAACDKGKGNNEGLPPAKDWNANVGDMPPVQQQGMPSKGKANPHAGAADPHAGLDMNDPHAGMNMGGAGSDPHAGLDMGGGHGGGGTDVEKLGLPPPDPNRKIDPTRTVTGTITVHAKAKARIAAGGAIFLVVKRADATGTPTGTPLAVDKLEWQKDAVPFEVSEKNAMVAGTELTGDVVITARYDQDGDALSKQPGDIVGSARVKIPAKNVTISLDDVIN